MRRREEDKLVECAFGDLHAEQEADVRARAAQDPEAARTLAAYAAMREGLRALRDVPADQMSTERMRDAILGQGLQPHPVARTWAWLWMPTAAAVLAYFAFVSPRGAPSVADRLVASNREPAVVGMSPDSLVLPSFDFQVPVNRKETSKAAPETTSRKQERRPRGTTPKRDLRVARDQVAPTPKAGGPVQGATRAMLTSLPDGGPSYDAAPAAPPEEIVYIQQEQDERTGANIATEVDTARNLAVGG